MTETHNVPNTLRGYIMDRLQSFQDAREKRAIYNRTVRELEALSGRELADLGFGRSQIKAIAMEAAYGK